MIRTYIKSMSKECERMDQCVLIIDDNENDVLITRRVLSQADANIRAEVACNGEEGLSRLRKDEPPALILLDAHRPFYSNNIFSGLKSITIRPDPINSPCPIRLR